MNKAHDRVTDELLVIRCQTGDREAFDMLVRRWQRRLWRYALRLTGSDAAAWDAVQETWMAMVRQLGKLGDPAWFAAWTYRIVRNKCADYCRRASRQRNLPDAAAALRKTNDEPTALDDSRETVREALRRLPADAQEVLMLRYGEGLNMLELAVVLGVPLGTVKSRLHHARERLRRILRGDDS